MEEFDIEKIRECLSCMEIQINKAKNHLDGIDNNLTEAYKAIDAVQFDYETLKELTRKK